MDDKVTANYGIDQPMTALLRFGRRTYGAAMMEALRENGCGDMPRHGMYIIGSIARTSIPLEALVRRMGTSKQAASQLVDNLFEKGYIERSVNPDDRRRMDVTLTERGKLAAESARAAADVIDKKLEEIVGEDYIKHTKTTLAALIDLNDIPYGPH